MSIRSLLSLSLILASSSVLAQEFVTPEIGIAPTGTNRSLVVKSPVGRVTVPMGYVDTNTQTYVSTGKVPTLNLGDVSDSPVSSLFLDRTLGQLANKLPGMPNAGIPTSALKDVTDFFAYGGKADGCGLCNTKPLSSITSLNGVNTTGYTLSQWQSFYSTCTDTKGRNPVTALSNEVDEIAIQCVINKKTQDGTLWLPTGLLYQTKPIISGQYALEVRGSGGRIATHLVQTKAGQDAWHHGTADTLWIDANNIPNYMSKLGFFGINFGCGGPGNAENRIVCGTAIRADFNGGTAGFFLRDVGIGGRGNQTFNFWHDGIKCRNCSLSEFQNVSIGGINTGAGVGLLSDTGTGIEFTGKGSVQYSIRDTTTNGWDYAITTTSGSKSASDLNGNQEGFVFDNWQANQVNYALTVNNVIGDGSESPQYVIVNSQFNVCKRLFYLAQVAEVFIKNNLTYGCTSGAQTGGTSDYTQYVASVQGSTTAGASTLTLAAPNANAIVGTTVYGPTIDGNTLITAVNGSVLSLNKPAFGSISGREFVIGRGRAGFDPSPFMVFNNVRRLTLRDNIFANGSAANINLLGHFRFVKDALVENNHLALVFNMTYNNLWWNDAGNERILEKNNIATGPSSWFNPVAAALSNVAQGVRFESFYKQYSSALRSDNLIQYDSSVVVNLDGNGDASVYMPPVYTEVPVAIQVSNGDMGANPAYCGVNRGLTNFGVLGIRCTSGIGSPLRINYNVVGK